MTVKGILLRYNGGHLYVGEIKDEERFLKIDTDNDVLAIGLAEEYLELHNTDANTLAASGRVLDGDQIPSDAYKVGDNIDGRLVQTYAVNMGEEAAADVTLELGDRLDQKLADLSRRIQRASRGVITHAAAPQINVQPKAKGTDKTPPPYSLGQVLYPSKSPAWSVASPFWVAFMEVTLETPGSKPSLIRLWKNNQHVGECWIGAGEKRSIVKIKPDDNGLGFLPRDFMIMEIKVAGTDAANLAVVLRGAMTGD